jgi:ABC-2 type transport system permease protein
MFQGVQSIALAGAAFTEAPHMHLFVIYPVVLAFAVAFLTVGLRNFRRRVLS